MPGIRIVKSKAKFFIFISSEIILILTLILTLILCEYIVD